MMQQKNINFNQAFAILGIVGRSSAEEARQAYRRLVKRWHPDQFAQNPVARADAEARLKAINQAYATVKIYLKTHPSTSRTGTAEEGAPGHPKTDFENRFRTTFHFRGRADSPPQPDPPPRTGPSAQAQRPAAADFREALNAAGKGHKTFTQPPAAASRPPRPSRRFRPAPGNRPRSTRIEPVEPISRIRPVAPISEGE